MLDIAFALSAAVFGAMAFFGFVVAPPLMRAVPGEAARDFERSFFPRYHGVFGTMTAVGAVSAALGGESTAGMLLALSALASLYAMGVITPNIEQARRAAASGRGLAGIELRRLRNRSVWMNAAQYALLAAAMSVLAAAQLTAG
jgi:hypothetical protein